MGRRKIMTAVITGAIVGAAAFIVDMILGMIPFVQNLSERARTAFLAGSITMGAILLMGFIG